jgi:thiamine biosynthesis lipoprotein
MRCFVHNLIYIFLVGTMCAILGSCAKNSQWRTVEGATWGTTYHITYYGDAQLDDSIVAVMRAIDLELSPFEPASVISHLNNNKTDSVGKMFASVFKESQRINKISGGAFDPTLAPLINLWGFGYTHPDSLTCDSAEVSRVMKCVGISECSISSNNIVSKKSNDTQFNFSAIAKGFGVDCVAEMLSRNGCENFLVEIGGEMSLKGHNPDGKDWRVQIDDPVTSANQHRKYALVSLTDCCIATSGNYRNFHTLADGTRVAHTISAVTGFPITSSTLSVTIVAPNCMTADALATSCMAMPLDDAKKMIEKEPHTSALFVVADGDTCRTVIAGPNRFK